MDFLTARAKRAAPGVMDVVALACLIASAAFWINLHWVLVSPGSIPDAGIAIGMGAIYTLVLPALWSILIPSTPAGMLLQRTQRRTLGFVFVIGAALFLTWHAATLLQVWWLSRPTVADGGQALPLTIACLIGFIGLPAFVWVQVTPDGWMARIQQAHLVRKLEIQHAADIAAVKIAYFRALDTLRVGLANVAAGDRREALHTLAGLQRAQNDTLQAIVGTIRDISGVERMVPTFDDAAIVERFDDLADQLDRRILTVNLSSDEHHATAVDDADPRRSPTIPDDPGSSTYAAARQALGTKVWMVRDLADALRCEEPTARKILGQWKQQGLVQTAGMNGRYSLTEGEAAR